jgi:AcrR family transcriptional regulator
MTQQTISQTIDNRKRAILASALKCFLQFGYAKTSMDDVAKDANLSRPLIYLKFKNKEDLYIGVIEFLTEGRFEQAEKIIESAVARKDKLIQVYEIFLLEPWEKIIGKPMTEDFYTTYRTLFQKIAEKYQRQMLKCTQNVLNDAKISETFILAVEGIKSDLPDTKVLRNRLHILIENFIR